MDPKRSWSRVEVERLVTDAIALYEEQRTVSKDSAEVAQALVEAEVAGNLDYDELTFRDERSREKKSEPA